MEKKKKENNIYLGVDLTSVTITNLKEKEEEKKSSIVQGKVKQTNIDCDILIGFLACLPV